MLSIIALAVISIAIMFGMFLTVAVIAPSGRVVECLEDEMGWPLGGRSWALTNPTPPTGPAQIGWDGDGEDGETEALITRHGRPYLRHTEADGRRWTEFVSWERWERCGGQR